jgi:hypothetical protein
VRPWAASHISACQRDGPRLFCMLGRVAAAGTPTRTTTAAMDVDVWGDEVPLAAARSRYTCEPGRAACRVLIRGLVGAQGKANLQS